MMRRGISAAAAALLLGFLAVILTACSTPYSGGGILGGSRETELEPGIWRVSFNGNGYTTYESVQTYWLYRCAELALEKGFDGFQIMSNVRLVGPPGADGEGDPAQLASVAQYYIPMYMPPTPSIQGDIRLLRLPISPLPPRVFDARELRSTLEALVKGAKCDAGNVCPHVHRYLYPASPESPAPRPTEQTS